MDLKIEMGCGVIFGVETLTFWNVGD